MLRRTLGRSGLEVGAIGFGCMSLGPDHRENARLVHGAIDKGIDLFDTADLYQHGLNEETLGRALQGRRSRVRISTKVGNQWRPDGSGWDWNPGKAYIHRAVKESLRRLRTDAIDLYQLHGGTLDDPWPDVVEAFEELQEEGTIRHYGISSIRPNVIDRWLGASKMTSVMMQYSLLDRRPEEECLDLVGSSRVGVLVRGGLAKGLLASTPKPAVDYLAHDAEAVRSMQATLAALDDGATPTQNALRYCLAHEAVTTVVCGIRTMEQLEENAAAGRLPPLAPDTVATLQAVLPPSVYGAHRRDSRHGGGDGAGPTSLY